MERGIPGIFVFWGKYLFVCDLEYEMDFFGGIFWRACQVTYLSLAFCFVLLVGYLKGVLCVVFYCVFLFCASCTVLRR